jgi:hypothetical protein
MPYYHGEEAVCRTVGRDEEACGTCAPITIAGPPSHRIAILVRYRTIFFDAALSAKRYGEGAWRHVGQSAGSFNENECANDIEKIVKNASVKI